MCIMYEGPYWTPFHTAPGLFDKWAMDCPRMLITHILWQRGTWLYFRWRQHPSIRIIWICSQGCCPGQNIPSSPKAELSSWSEHSPQTWHRTLCVRCLVVEKPRSFLVTYFISVKHSIHPSLSATPAPLPVKAGLSETSPEAQAGPSSLCHSQHTDRKRPHLCCVWALGHHGQ